MAATSADRYRFDDWSLEPSEARLLKAGEPVAIEPRAFDVLAYFLANPLRLVTKEELLEHAWPGVAVSDNALTRAIARLRKVLEDDARAPRYLETVHSRGYRFRVQPEIESRERGKIARASEEMESPSPGRPRAPGRRRAAVSAALALALVAALGGWRLIRLPGGEKLDSAVARAPSESVRAQSGGDAESSFSEAMGHYRRGRERYRQQTRIGNEQAIESYALALAADPEFALAHAGLANAYALRVIRYGFEPRWRHEAEAAARWALRLDPALPEAHKAQGLLHDLDERLEPALESYRRALELHPGYVEAAYNASTTAFALGRWDEAVDYQLRDVERPNGRAALAILLFELGLEASGRELASEVLELEPLHGYLGSYLALRSTLDGGLDRGRRQAERLAQAYPTWWRPRWVLAEIALREDDADAALAEYTAAVELSGEGDWEAALGLAAVLNRGGEKARAETLMESIEADATARLEAGSTWHVHSFRLAAIAALRGQRQTAIEHFAAAFAAGRLSPSWDAVHPALASVRSDPDFEALLEGMRERIDQQRQAVLAKTDFASLSARIRPRS